jgi:hypothetical protein
MLIEGVWRQRSENYRTIHDRGLVMLTLLRVCLMSASRVRDSWSPVVR